MDYDASGFLECIGWEGETMVFSGRVFLGFSWDVRIWNWDLGFGIGK